MVMPYMVESGEREGADRCEREPERKMVLGMSVGEVSVRRLRAFGKGRKGGEESAALRASGAIESVMGVLVRVSRSSAVSWLDISIAGDVFGYFGDEWLLTFERGERGGVLTIIFGDRSSLARLACKHTPFSVTKMVRGLWVLK